MNFYINKDEIVNLLFQQQQQQQLSQKYSRSNIDFDGNKPTDDVYLKEDVVSRWLRVYQNHSVFNYR